LAEHFLKRHPRQEEPGGEFFIIPVLFVDAPSTPSEIELYDSILAAMDAPMSRSMRAGEKLRQIKVLAKRSQLKLLMIDEIHNQLAGSTKKQLVQANVIKGLSNELRVSMVLLGTYLAYNALKIDAQYLSLDPRCADERRSAETARDRNRPRP